MDDDEADPASGIVYPRLSDVFGLIIRQDEVDFVAPHLREDMPLYLDPFLLWKSDYPQCRPLHADLLGFVEEVRRHAVDGQATRAAVLCRRSASRSSLAWAAPLGPSGAPPWAGAPSTASSACSSRSPSCRPLAWTTWRSSRYWGAVE